MTPTINKRHTNYLTNKFVYNHLNFYGMFLFLTAIVVPLLFLRHTIGDPIASIKPLHTMHHFSVTLYNQVKKRSILNQSILNPTNHTIHVTFINILLA